MRFCCLGSAPQVRCCIHFPTHARSPASLPRSLSRGCLQQCNEEDSLCSYDYTTSAVWNGTTVVNNTKVDSWTWQEG